MSSRPFCEAEDHWENAYFHYIRSLRALASSPEEACSLYDHFNVAYELWYEVRGGVHLVESPKHRLSPEHGTLISELAAALEQLPPEAIAHTDVAQESLSRLKHPSWGRPRGLAARLLLQLGQVTSSNLAYINSPKVI
jgi:hypothetical protein